MSYIIYSICTVKNRTDGDAPYILLQTFPHHQFTAGDETCNLRELGLTPSGTLIMKAGKSISNAYSAAEGVNIWGYVESAVGVVTSIVGGVASIMSGVIGSAVSAGGNVQG